MGPAGNQIKYVQLYLWMQQRILGYWIDWLVYYNAWTNNVTAAFATRMCPGNPSLSSGIKAKAHTAIEIGANFHAA